MDRISGKTKINTSNGLGLKTLDLAYIAVSAALIAVCSWIQIPTVVPFTLQTFAVFFLMAALGGKRGTAAVLVYILLGAVGLVGIYLYPARAYRTSRIFRFQGRTCRSLRNDGRIHYGLYASGGHFLAV